MAPRAKGYIRARSRRNGPGNLKRQSVERFEYISRQGREAQGGGRGEQIVAVKANGPIVMVRKLRFGTEKPTAAQTLPWKDEAERGGEGEFALLNL